MQLRGDMSRSWTLTAFASRILVSLNYHAMEQTLEPSERTLDIQAAVYSCFYLDKLLSVLLLRPSSLPKLKVTPAELIQLDPRLPLSAILKAMVEFGQIQEGVLDIIFNHKNKDDQVTAINALVQDMHNMRALMDEVSKPVL